MAEDRTGIFFEVGAYGAYACYLMDHDWLESSRRRHKEGKELYAPFEFAVDYDHWDVYFIEPLAHNMAWLQKHVAKHYPQSNFVQVAVGGYDGFEELEVVNMSSVADGIYGSDSLASIKKSSLFNEAHPEAVENYSFYSQIITLDTLFKSLDVYPTILRMDIEGAEVDALEVYSFSPAPRIIQVDAHLVNNDRCCEIIESRGYDIVDRKWGDYKDDIYAVLKESK